MVEAPIGRLRSRIDAVAWIHLGGEDHGPAKLDVDARLSKLGAADDLGTEHALEPLRHRLRIGRAQMDVIPGKGRHWRFSLNGHAKLGRTQALSNRKCDQRL